MKRERHGAELLAEVVREAYLSRSSGVAEVEDGLPSENLYFRDGELFFEPRHPLAARVRTIFEQAGPDFRPASEPQLLQMLGDLALGFGGHRRGRFRKDSAAPPGLVGPLPTVWLAMQLAVVDCDEDMLLARLGGEDMRYRSAGNSPALHQLPSLDIELTQLLTRLEHPATPVQLAKGAEQNRLTLFQDLSKLRAIGLAEPVDARRADDVLSHEILQRLSERVAESLESDPLTLEIDQHLKRLGELLANLRSYDHYELLEVGHQSTDDEIYKAYNRLARQVHPSHAARLGLKGREEALRVLFEWATEAYLTLSHSTRRFRYNLMMGIRAQITVDEDQRQEEKRTIALQNYRRAAFALSEMDYSLAIDLLKESVRLDPQPEYFARLAQAQAKNPHWHRHALANFKRSIASRPDDAGFRVGYGEFLEKIGRADEARAQYLAALETMPDHPAARVGLERLAGRRGNGKTSRLGNSLRNLFGSSEPE